jgi:hypothetical protein
MKESAGRIADGFTCSLSMSGDKFSHLAILPYLGYAAKHDLGRYWFTSVAKAWRA